MIHVIRPHPLLRSTYCLFLSRADVLMSILPYLRKSICLIKSKSCKHNRLTFILLGLDSTYSCRSLHRHVQVRRFQMSSYLVVEVTHKALILVTLSCLPVKHHLWKPEVGRALEGLQNPDVPNRSKSSKP